MTIARLRVLTLNVQNDEGGPRRIGVLNEGLRRVNADLVALQEVLRTPARNQLDELLDGTGLQGTHQADLLAYSPPWADRYGGSAVASRWPHQLVEVLDLRLADAADVRWFTLAAFVPIPGDLDIGHDP